jgi:hypothetical protein
LKRILAFTTCFRDIKRCSVPLGRNAKSKITYSSRSDMKSRKICNDKVDNRDDWANRSGIYRDMSEYQRDTLERIITHLEKMVGDDH